MTWTKARHILEAERALDTARHLPTWPSRAAYLGALEFADLNQARDRIGCR